MANCRNIKYHEDNVEKRMLTINDIEFLFNIQKEMNTQDSVCQADPRYWVIKGSEYEFGIANGYEDGCTLIDKDGEIIGENLEILSYFIKEDIFPELDDNDETSDSCIFQNDCIIITRNKKETIISDLDDLNNWLNSVGIERYRLANYKIREKIYENTMFLTNIDAENHLKLNHYHYSNDAHTYAMTAGRSYSMEKMYDILQNVDFESLKIFVEKTKEIMDHEIPMKINGIHMRDGNI